MSSLFFILLCCFSAWFLYIWFYTDVFSYYIKALKFIFPKKIYNWLLIDEYFVDFQTKATSLIGYLVEKKSFSENFAITFFIKLFGCIICLTTWVSIIIALIMGNILYIGVTFLILRILDYILRHCSR